MGTSAYDFDNALTQTAIWFIFKSDDLQRGGFSMARRKYRHEWDDLASINSDFIGRWGAFKGYNGPLEFDGLTPSRAHAVHDVERDTLTVIYTDEKGAPVHRVVHLKRQPCTYGGSRVYFTAPCCGRRVRNLALLDGGLLCGPCGSITNTSKRKSGVQRLILKAAALSVRLECANWLSPPTERPKGMRRETFNRLADEHAALVAQARRIIAPRLARAAGRSPGSYMSAMLRYHM